MRRWLLAIVVLGCIAVVLAEKAGSFLVVDAPRRSDLILVLAGETERRPQRALELLAQGYGRRIVLDVPAHVTIYEYTQLQLAEKYVHDLPQGAAVMVCPIEGLFDQGRVEGRGEVYGAGWRWQCADRDLGLSYAARAQRLAPGASGT